MSLLLRVVNLLDARHTFTEKGVNFLANAPVCLPYWRRTSCLAFGRSQWPKSARHSITQMPVGRAT